MANESLKKLKETLIQTKKYTGLNINTDSLDKLRTSVNQMIDVMNQTRPVGPNVTAGNISGTTCGSLTESYKWIGGVLAPNGKIYGIPYSATTVLEIDVGSCYEPCDWALSPLVNKF